MKGKVLGAVGLITLLAVLSVVVPQVSPNVSAEDPSWIPLDQTFPAPTSKELETVGTAGDKYCCGYHSPNNPYNCWCKGIEGNCIWWAYYMRSETLSTVEPPWTGDRICPSDWDNYAIDEGLPVGAIPRLQL